MSSSDESVLDAETMAPNLVQVKKTRQQSDSRPQSTPDIRPTLTLKDWAERLIELTETSEEASALTGRSSSSAATSAHIPLNTGVSTSVVTPCPLSSHSAGHDHKGRTRTVVSCAIVSNIHGAEPETFMTSCPDDSGPSIQHNATHGDSHHSARTPEKPQTPSVFQSFAYVPTSDFNEDLLHRSMAVRLEPLSFNPFPASDARCDTPRSPLIQDAPRQESSDPLSSVNSQQQDLPDLLPTVFPMLGLDVLSTYDFDFESDIFVPGNGNFPPADARSKFQSFSSDTPRNPPLFEPNPFYSNSYTETSASTLYQKVRGSQEPDAWASTDDSPTTSPRNPLVAPSDISWEVEAAPAYNHQASPPTETSVYVTSARVSHHTPTLTETSLNHIAPTLSYLASTQTETSFHLTAPVISYQTASYLSTSSKPIALLTGRQTPKSRHQASTHITTTSHPTESTSSHSSSNNANQENLLYSDNCKRDSTALLQDSQQQPVQKRKTNLIRSTSDPMPSTESNPDSPFTSGCLLPDLQEQRPLSCDIHHSFRYESDIVTNQPLFRYEENRGITNSFDQSNFTDVWLDMLQEGMDRSLQSYEGGSATPHTASSGILSSTNSSALLSFSWQPPLTTSSISQDSVSSTHLGLPAHPSLSVPPMAGNVASVDQEKFESGQVHIASDQYPNYASNPTTSLFSPVIENAPTSHASIGITSAENSSNPSDIPTIRSLPTSSENNITFDLGPGNVLKDYPFLKASSSVDIVQPFEFNASFQDSTETFGPHYLHILTRSTSTTAASAGSRPQWSRSISTNSDPCYSTSTPRVSRVHTDSNLLQVHALSEPLLNMGQSTTTVPYSLGWDENVENISQTSYETLDPIPVSHTSDTERSGLMVSLTDNQDRSSTATAPPRATSIIPRCEYYIETPNPQSSSSVTFTSADAAFKHGEVSGDSATPTVTYAANTATPAATHTVSIPMVPLQPSTPPVNPSIRASLKSKLIGKRSCVETPKATKSRYNSPISEQESQSPDISHTHKRETISSKTSSLSINSPQTQAPHVSAPSHSGKRRKFYDVLGQCEERQPPRKDLKETKRVFDQTGEASTTQLSDDRLHQTPKRPEPQPSTSYNIVEDIETTDEEKESKEEGYNAGTSVKKPNEPKQPLDPVAQRTKNRLAARSCRRKRQMKLERLTMQVSRLEEKQQRIQSEVDKLADEKRMLQDMLDTHGPCKMRKQSPSQH